jgi:AraC-like DNA-binding protein
LTAAVTEDRDSGDSGDYREHRPSGALRPFVSCFWSRVTRGRSEVRVLPDGAVDILFDLAASSDDDASFVVGTMTRALVVASPPSATSDFVAVRFRPGAAHAVLGLPASELTDRREHLGGTCSWASHWAARLAEGRGLDGRLRLLDELLCTRIAKVEAPDARVAAGIRWISDSHGNVSVEQVSGRLGLSRQQLTRLFDRDVGVGVKVFARIARLQALLRALRGEGETAALEERPDWARLAIDLGFYDQAHMGAELKALTGLTPRQFGREVGLPRRVSRGSSQDRVVTTSS